MFMCNYPEFIIHVGCCEWGRIGERKLKRFDDGCLTSWTDDDGCIMKALSYASHTMYLIITLLHHHQQPSSALELIIPELTRVKFSWYKIIPMVLLSTADFLASTLIRWCSANREEMQSQLARSDQWQRRLLRLMFFTVVNVLLLNNGCLALICD